MAGGLTSLLMQHGIGGLVRAPEPETTALIARFSTAPSSTQAANINRLIRALKDNDTWTKRDCLYLMAGHNGTGGDLGFNARQNWIQDLYNLTVVGTTTFTEYRGYAGNGTDGYLNTNFNPATASTPKYVRDSAHIGLSDRTVRAASASSVEMSMQATNFNISISTRSTADVMVFRVNGVSSVGSAANTLSSGRFVASRTGSAAVEGARNGASLGTSTIASAALASFNIYIGSRNQSGTASNFSSDQFSEASIGSGLTIAEIAADDAAFAAYFAAIGA